MISTIWWHHCVSHLLLYIANTRVVCSSCISRVIEGTIFHDSQNFDFHVPHHLQFSNFCRRGGEWSRHHPQCSVRAGVKFQHGNAGITIFTFGKVRIAHKSANIVATENLQTQFWSPWNSPSAHHSRCSCDEWNIKISVTCVNDWNDC